LKECDLGLALKMTDPYLKLNKLKALLLSKRDNEGSPLVQDFLLSETPYPEEINIHLVSLFEKKKMLGEMTDLLVKYISHDPSLFFPYAKLASIYLSKGESEKARGILLDGMSKTAIFSMREFLPDLRSPELNFSPKELALELSKSGRQIINPELIEASKGILIFQGTHESERSVSLKTSKEILEKVISKDKSIPYAYLTLGYIYVQMDNAKKGLVFLKKAKEMDADAENPLIDFALALALNKLGKTADAGNYLKDLAENKALKFMVSYEFGNTALAKGNKNDALKFYRSSYEAKGDSYPAIQKLFKFGD